MFTKISLIATAAACTAIVCQAQQQVYSRQAAITGGGGPDRGKCTVEVVVDGAAEVEVRGATGILRNLHGQPPQWRRFECTSPMPANVGDFRFAGVDGRGRQELVRDPRSGGSAVVRIEDPDSGSEGYTFDLFWGGGMGNNRPGPAPYNDRGDNRDRGETRPPEARGPQRTYDYPEDRYRPNYRDSDYYRRYRHGFGADEAVRVCQESIAQQAARRFRDMDFHFRGIRMDDGPGRQDWVVGSIDVHRNGREERFNFSCSVDFDSGRVRTAQMDQMPSEGYRR